MKCLTFIYISQGCAITKKRERDRLEEMLLSMLFITKINNSYKYKAIWFTFIGVIILAFISRALLDLRTVNCHI